MIIQPILALIIFQQLRKFLQTKEQLPYWDKVFKIGSGIAVVIMFFYSVAKNIQFILPLVSDALLFGAAWLVYTKNELNRAKSNLYAYVPVIIIYSISDIVRLISSSFHNEWGTYFETAKLFGIIWLAAMFIINNRQRKALEKERLKAEQIEKESRITAKIKEQLEVQVKERTAEITKQKEALEHTLEELKSAQALLVQSEKMASLGELTAGIAHEIQNPLNFVNNFSEVSAELIDEMNDAIAKGDNEEVKAIAGDLKQNLDKINHHGKRADAIVKGMLQHSRSSSGTKEPTDINALCDEYMRLSYHGLRAKDKSFNATLHSNFDSSMDTINIIAQDVGRVILNLLTNAFYAVKDKQRLLNATPNAPAYAPTVAISTKKQNGSCIITVTDNGNGIPQQVLDKIFQPFFTTKPTGEGTGLGLSLSYDIIKAHGGELNVETMEGEGASFIIKLPV
ncbi:MAG: histidine kinase [Bacteroidetes bacterium]|nr:histidine kinase [Bacteroidota bacterium]